MKSNTEMSKQIDLEKLRHDAEDMSNISLIHTVNDLIDRIAALEKENASLKQDAARYRMLRNNVKALDTGCVCIFDRDGWEIYGLLQGDKLDREIDTAMEASNA